MKPCDICFETTEFGNFCPKHLYELEQDIEKCSKERPEKEVIPYVQKTNNLKGAKLASYRRWLENKDKVLQSSNIIQYEENDSGDKITILFKVDNTVDYFPKSDKLLIRRENKWITNGLIYLKQNLL